MLQRADRYTVPLHATEVHTGESFVSGVLTHAQTNKLRACTPCGLFCNIKLCLLAHGPSPVGQAGVASALPQAMTRTMEHHAVGAAMDPQSRGSGGK